jgi:hypothetical protein
MKILGYAGGAVTDRPYICPLRSILTMLVCRRPVVARNSIGINYFGVVRIKHFGINFFTGKLLFVL